MLWKNRCSRIFGDANIRKDDLLASCLRFKDDIIAVLDVSHSGIVANQEQARWKALSNGWVNIKVDGAVGVLETCQQLVVVFRITQDIGSLVLHVAIDD
ncbi:hypothetical protein V6N13_081142 [Hibiscus sabdariffa]|uniref:Uncharacterized protein n=1 Tax=Hibiscus sabdariffa TaxID=183260 RepID=A0ABR2DBL5_9ROSI